MIETVEIKYKGTEIICYVLKKKNDNSQYIVPLNPTNKDYQDIQEYIKNGGVIIDNPPLPTEEISE